MMPPRRGRGRITHRVVVIENMREAPPSQFDLSPVDSGKAPPDPRFEVSQELDWSIVPVNSFGHFRRQKLQASAGIDEVTVADYEERLRG